MRQVAELSEQIRLPNQIAILFARGGANFVDCPDNEALVKL
jgi:hypothetical protein